MKILASFLILITLCSFAYNKKSMKLTIEKSTKSTSESKIKETSQINKADPGAILPAAAVIF